MSRDVTRQNHESSMPYRHGCILHCLRVVIITCEACQDTHAAPIRLTSSDTTDAPGRSSLILNIYIYIYMCIYIHICIHTSVCVYTYIYIYIYISLSLSIYICIHMYIYIYIYTCIYVVGAVVVRLLRSRKLLGNEHVRWPLNCGSWPWSMVPVSVNKQFLLREPWPCDPAAEAAIQPQIWCFQS